MSTAYDKGKELLSNLKALYPWRFDSVPTDPTRMPADLVVGAIRSKDGKNVIQPHPESASMVVSFPATIDLIVNAPKVIDGLLKEIDALRAATLDKSVTLEEAMESPDRGSKIRGKIAEREREKTAVEA